MQGATVLIQKEKTKIYFFIKKKTFILSLERE